ncbi:MAG TPA: exodeoxyribonuclease VII large subunit [Acidimicrobiales bacterium]|nr:exodeoxyribonuclease VII large subunit [Acidimicrobiales bacterium]
MNQLGFEVSAVRRLSLVKLSSEIARSLSAVGRVAVEGEVVNPRSHPGGVYFTLRDRAAQVPVRAPASRAGRWRLVAGERVLVTGTVTWLTDRGALQFVADDVAPVGEGAIAAALAERRARLAADGLLDRPRRALPVLPAAIGVVCGTEAAVRADIESVVAARFPGYPVAWVATNVSGPGAADAITAALLSLDARPEVEVIVLARGGGDAAQLLPFSDEDLCRAICGCTTPVVSAVGHDGDRPLCDEVADLRCGTPSLAAAAVVPDRAALEAVLERLAERRAAALGAHLVAASTRLAAVDRRGAVAAALDGARRRLDQAGARARLVHPARAVAAAAERLDRVDWRSPARRRCDGERRRLDAAGRHLDALSPARVLARGYAVVRDGSGAVIRDSAAVAAGACLDVELAAGRLAVRVEEAR